MTSLDRRLFLRGIASLPLAALLANPALAQLVANSLDNVSINLPGGDKAIAALALPETTPAPAVLLVHEWWGLNDQIKTMAAELAREGYVALAVDLFNGQLATTPEEASALTEQVEEDEATQMLASWLEWLKTHSLTNGEVATIGWCFGGGWALRAAIAEPVDATVIYYGRVNQPAEKLVNLEGPVLGHFATQDQFIDEKMVADFSAEMEKADKPLEQYWYQADHAFANPTGANYDEADAKLAWERTLAFLDKHLKEIG